MIEVRKHPDFEAALYISGLGLKLPEDHSWVFISDRFSVDEIEGSQNLANAFKERLIEMRVDGDYNDVPSWYLEAYAEAVRIPTELLEDNELAVIQKLRNLKAAAHPLVWAVVRSGLFSEESVGQGRSAVFELLGT